MSQNPFPPQGGQFPQQGGQFPQQGGQFPQQGGQFPPQGGQFPPQGGQFPPQGGQFPPQGGYGGPPGGYGQAPMGYGGQQPPKKSNRTIIAIVLGAVIVVALIGLAFVFFSKPQQAVEPTLPPIQPTTTTQTTQPTETTPAPQPDPTTNQTSQPPQPQPQGQGVSIGNGLSVVPAEGWQITDQTDTSVSLKDAAGHIFSVNSGKSNDVKADVQAVLDQVVQGTDNIRKSEVVTPEAPPGTELAMQGAQVTVSGGGGSIELFTQVAVAARTNDRIGFAAILILPAADAKDKAVGDQVNLMLNSAFQSLLQGV